MAAAAGPPRRQDTHTPLADGTPLAEAAVEAFLAGLTAVQPDAIVKRAVRQGLVDDWLFGPGSGGTRERPRMIDVLAIGKAAPRMVWGLVEAGVPFRGIGVAPRGVSAPGIDTFQWHVGEHPVPGAQSLAAGHAVEAWCDALPRDAPLLVLLSGGSSACIETPADGLSPDALRRGHEELFRAGLPIEELNRRRQALSGVKGGKLGRRILARTPNVRVWVLADTDPATASATIGSALFWQEGQPASIAHTVLASVDDAVVAAGLRLGSGGWAVYRHARRIAGPIEEEVAGFLAALAQLPPDQDVALVAGGEAELPIPSGSPAGGRAQHAALLAARGLHASSDAALVLCAATDGVDGLSDAAGAWVTGADWADAPAEAQDALARLAAHEYLKRRRRLLHTGPTGTNVNDVWVALRRAR